MQSFKDFFNAKIAKEAAFDREGVFLKPKIPGVRLRDLEAQDDDSDWLARNIATRNNSPVQQTPEDIAWLLQNVPSKRRVVTKPRIEAQPEPEPRYPADIPPKQTTRPKTRAKTRRLPTPATSATPPVPVVLQQPQVSKDIEQIRQLIMPFNKVHALMAMLPGISDEEASHIISQYHEE